ncbi:peptidase M15 [Bacillus sp. V3-13]|uniref:M15 family metallopeptidase n=1 Tax=Bacillus sp. V3-13 TaxID=2053728 RepID=UPI000C786293|nr:M15 family metallopeptidase [Bacillus sp. V3-13]PLR78494.1 peptidase M15 [Bacillus sp. V3-13]
MLKRMANLLLFLLIAVGILLFYNFYSTQVEQTNSLTNLFPQKDAPMPVKLHPLVEDKTNELVAVMADVGITVVITEGFRSIEEQDALYEKGRTAEGDIVTHAKGGESFHNFGLAVDFALKTPDGGVIWDMEYDGNGNAKADWMEVVKAAKKLGFEWGGDWQHFKDYPHLQMSLGLTIHDLQRGMRPDADEQWLENSEV